MADRHALAVFPLSHGTYYIKFCHYYIVGVHLAVRCIQKFSRMSVILAHLCRAPWKGAFLWRVRIPPNTCRSGW